LLLLLLLWVKSKRLVVKLALSGMQQDATNIALTTTTTMVMMMKKMSSWQRVDRDAMIGWSEA